MPRYETSLEGSEELAAGTMAFHFDRPAGFDFRAGQSVKVELVDPPAEPNTARRIFSLVSAPFEDRLTIATRMREGSAFKRSLKSLPPGSRIRLAGPQGVMTLHPDLTRAGVFIAGGIGITPFISMLRQAAHDRLAQRLLLLYSNRRPEDSAFLAELRELERLNERFSLHATMTDMDKSTTPWDGERGMLDEVKMRHFVGSVAAPVYYLAGPPLMVDAMLGVLRRTGVPDEDLRSEEFYGY